MPTLDWLNRDAAFRITDKVPYRLLEFVSEHQVADASAANPFSIPAAQISLFLAQICAAGRVHFPILN
jgi:hypothetical protein